MSVQSGGTTHSSPAPAGPSGAAADVLAHLYDIYGDHLFDYCNMVLGSPQAAAEAVRETLIAATAQFGRLRDRGRIRGWLFAIARRQCLRELAPRSGAASLDELMGEKDPAPGSDAAFSSADLTSTDVSWAAMTSAAAGTDMAAADTASTDAAADDTASTDAAATDAASADVTDADPGRAGVTRADPGDADRSGADIAAADTAAGGALTFPEAGRPGDGDADTADLAVADIEAEVRRRETLLVVTAALAGLAARDREALSLVYRHGISGADLGDALGLSAGRARALLAGAVSRFEKSAAAVAVLRAGWQGCPVPAMIVGDWDPGADSLTPPVLKRLARHIESCASCAEDARRQVFSPELIVTIALAVPPAMLRAEIMTSAIEGDDDLGGAAALLASLDDKGFPARPGRLRAVVRDDKGFPARPGRVRAVVRDDKVFPARPGRRRAVVRAAVACAAALVLAVAAGALLRTFLAAPARDSAAGTAAAAAVRKGPHNAAPGGSSPLASPARSPRSHMGRTALALFPFPGALGSTPAPGRTGLPVPLPSLSGRTPAPTPTPHSSSPQPSPSSSSSSGSPSPSPSSTSPSPSSSPSPTSPSPSPTSPSAGPSSSPSSGPSSSPTSSPLLAAGS
jgi:RNA polymerase sigma factor (sigma-70 family)